MPETPTLEIELLVKGDPHSAELPACIGKLKARHATPYQVGVCFGMLQQWIDRNAETCRGQLAAAAQSDDGAEAFDAGFDSGRNEAETVINNRTVARVPRPEEG